MRGFLVGLSSLTNAENALRISPRTVDYNCRRIISAVPFRGRGDRFLDVLWGKVLKPAERGARC